VGIADALMVATAYRGCGARLTPAQIKACGQGVADLSDESLQLAADEALYLFDLATDFTFRGECTSTIRPCRVRARCGWGRYTPEMIGQLWPSGLPPVLWGSMMAGMWPCGCSGAECSGCTILSAVRLPFLPVRSVTEVKIDGTVLDPTKWRLVPGTNLLVRTDDLPWPTAQNAALADTQAGTWSITFAHGLDLPPGLARRIGSAAAEFARACANLPCKLPEGARIESKGDINFVVFDKYRDDGLTGFSSIDDWIMTWRGGKDRARIRPTMARPGRRRSGSTREF
jgi:hypothetical protein